MAKLKIENHELVPKHSKLNEKEKKELLEMYKITPMELPRILLKDPTIENLKVKAGDVIKIARKSRTAGETVYYRCVVNG